MQPIGLYRIESGIIARVDHHGFDLGPFSIDSLFHSEDPRQTIEDALEGAEEVDPEELLSLPLLPPVGNQEIWAAGVTYLRSRSARMEEAEQAGGDVFYDLVYDADRPELFFKATAARCRGPGDSVGIRKDSSWDVPEPELALAINRNGTVFGYSIGNDMSSRSIEGENPLYLPQAKVYQASCALGPALWIMDPPPPETLIRIQIDRGDKTVFQGETPLSQMKRDLEELTGWLYRHNELPDGAYLMTGTGIVPDSDFTLAAGDEICIAIDGLGELTNSVVPV